MVVFGRGLTGVTGRSASSVEPVEWFRTPTATGDEVVAAFDDDRHVVVLVTEPGLARWTLDLDRGTARRDVIDPSPQRDGHIDGRRATSPVRCCYALAGAPSSPGTAIHRHDLTAGTRASHPFGDGRHPDAFVFVGDPARSIDEDGGWLIGLVHDGPSERVSLVVLDAADLGRAPLASVRLLPPMSEQGRGLWSRSIPA